MQLPRLNPIVLLSLLTLVASSAVPPPSLAFTATNNDSQLQINDIDIAPTATPIPPHPGKRQPRVVVQPERKPSSVKQGTKPTAERKFFTFSLSSTEVDFGTIDPTNPVIRTHTLKLDPASAESYSVFAYENHVLRLPDQENSFIPDTTCDDGNCTESIASPWQNTLTYGLGFRCDQDQGVGHCMSEFADQQSYKQFADLSRNEIGSMVLTGSGAEPAAARITYKVNLPGTQKPGAYSNVLLLIAAPGY